MPLHAAFMGQNSAGQETRRREFIAAITRAGLDAQFSTPLGQDVFKAYCAAELTLDEALARTAAVSLAR